MAVQSFVVALCVAAVLVDSMSMYTNDGSPITADAEQPISDGALADSALTETKRRMIARRFEGFSLNAYDDYDAAMSAWAEGLSDDDGEEDYYDFEMGSGRSNGYEDVDYAALSAWFDGLSDEEVEYYYDLEMDAPELINVGTEPIAQANDGLITADAEQPIVSDGALADSALTEKKRRLIARRFEGFSLNAYDDDNAAMGAWAEELNAYDDDDAAMSAWAEGLSDDDEDDYYDFEMGSGRSNGYDDVDYAALNAWVDGLSDEEVEYYYDLEMEDPEEWQTPELITVGRVHYSKFFKYSCRDSVGETCSVSCNGGCGTTYIKVVEGTEKVEVICTVRGACRPMTLFMINGDKQQQATFLGAATQTMYKRSTERATDGDGFTGSVNCKKQESCSGATFAIHNFAMGTIVNSQNALNCDFIFTRVDIVKIGNGADVAGARKEFNGNQLRTGEVKELIITAGVDSFQGATIDTRGAERVNIHCKGKGSCEEMVIIYMVYDTTIEVRCGPGACQGLTFFMKDKITEELEEHAEMAKTMAMAMPLVPFVLPLGPLAPFVAKKALKVLNKQRQKRKIRVLSTEQRVINHRTARAKIATGITRSRDRVPGHNNPRITVTFVDAKNIPILYTSPGQPDHSLFSLMAISPASTARTYMPTLTGRSGLFELSEKCQQQLKREEVAARLRRQPTLKAQTLKAPIKRPGPLKTTKPICVAGKDKEIQIFVVDVDVDFGSSESANFNRVLANRQKVSFYFQNNLEINGLISKDAITKVMSEDGVATIKVNEKSGQAKGLLLAKFTAGAVAEAAGTTAAIIGVTTAAVGLATATAGVALIPYGLAAIGFGIKWSLNKHQANREDQLKVLFSTGFESKATLSEAQRTRFQVDSKWVSYFKQGLVGQTARYDEYADALGEEAGQGHRSSMHGRRGRGRRAASARRNAKRLIRLSDLHYTD